MRQIMGEVAILAIELVPLPLPILVLDVLVVQIGTQWLGRGVEQSVDGAVDELCRGVRRHGKDFAQGMGRMLPLLHFPSKSYLSSALRSGTKCSASSPVS